MHADNNAVMLGQAPSRTPAPYTKPHQEPAAPVTTDNKPDDGFARGGHGIFGEPMVGLVSLENLR